MKKEKLDEEMLDSPKRERSEFEPPAGLICSLTDQPSPKKCKLEDRSVQFTSVVASWTSVVPKNRIQLVKDSIESRHFVKALKLINDLQSEFPHSALVLALKALIYEKNANEVEVLSVCSDAKDCMFSDTSALPDVLATLDTVCQRLNRLDMATRYYEHACGDDYDSLELMRGLFNCYARQSSFANQLKVSLRMYKLVRDDKFLFWAVFCIQLQVLYHLRKKHGMDHNLVEPEAFLVYMSITELHETYDPVREILYKLGPTLLVVKADKQHLEGGKVLAHVCDYAAAVEVLKKILESCPHDWESLLNDFGSSLDDDSKWCGGTTVNKIQPPVYLACKISQLPNNKCGSEISRALKLSNLENALNICRDGKDNDVFKEAIYEYSNRVDHRTQRFFEILSKDEEYRLIENLSKPDNLTTDLLKGEFSKISTVSKIPKYYGDFHLGVKSVVHGTTIVLKTSKFIILASDGKLSSAYSDNALLSTIDKIRQFDDLCIAITGVWKGLSSTVSILRKHMRCLNKNGKRRPTARKFAEYIAEESHLLNRATEIIVCAFDELEGGQHSLPCVSCVDKSMCWDVKESFYCSGSCSRHAERILSEGNVRLDMELAEAIDLVEKALVYVAMFDNCSGGFANITVIDHCKNVKVMAREHIRTTLWERHHHFFENMKKRSDKE